MYWVYSGALWCLQHRAQETTAVHYCAHTTVPKEPQLCATVPAAPCPGLLALGTKPKASYVIVKHSVHYPISIQYSDNMHVLERLLAPWEKWAWSPTSMLWILKKCPSSVWDLFLTVWNLPSLVCSLQSFLCQFPWRLCWRLHTSSQIQTTSSLKSPIQEVCLCFIDCWIEYWLQGLESNHFIQKLHFKQDYS